MPRVALLAIGAAVLIAGCGGAKATTSTRAPASSATTPQAAGKPTIRIGTKNFTEELILGELYKQALVAKGLPVVLKSDIGPTEIVHNALTGGALDMYPEYVGTLLAEVALEKHPSGSAATAYRDALAFEKPHGFTLLSPTPFENRDAVAVLPAYASRHQLRTVGDLRHVRGEIRMAAPGEFRERRQGLLGLQDTYGLKRVRVVVKKIGAQYAALLSGQVQTADVFTTDGQLAQHCCVVLTDPRGVFGTQHVAPIISVKIVKLYGKPLTGTLNEVSALLTTSAMQKMNAAVDIDHRNPRDVAADFLRSHPIAAS